MKFARYLQDTQTPEWKRAYIDYRKLKVQLGIIRSQVPQQANTLGSVGATDVDLTYLAAPTNAKKFDGPQEYHNPGNTTSAPIENTSVSGVGPVAHSITDSNGHGQALPIRRRTKPLSDVTLSTLPPRVTSTTYTPPPQQTSLPPRAFTFFKDSAGSSTPQPLHTILANLAPTHARFFIMLDAELEKVETFYAEREKEMNEHAKRLMEQLNELEAHHQRIHGGARPKVHALAKKTFVSIPSMLLSLIPPFAESNTNTKELDQINGAGARVASESVRHGHRGIIHMPSLGINTTEHVYPSDNHARPSAKGEAKSEEDKNSEGTSKIDAHLSAQEVAIGSLPNRSNNLISRPFDGHHSHDSHGYQHAKKRLRKAVVEYYRGLEVLNNYRILNLIGFRKALKKYEKITKNSVLDAYMNEKVEPSAFAAGAMVNVMLKEMEDLFTTRFERGDRKRALNRLRVGPLLKTHHFSAFRSGVWLGLALPAIIGGTFLSFGVYTRGSLPAWDILLFIYSVFLLPVLMALLIGVNIAVWARERINYIFIFDLNPKSRLDHHEYFELPSFFFCTLAYAFWFSFAQIGPPLLWPLIWLALILVIVFNPICNFARGPARWWTIKNVAKLGTSGIWKVEFTDFWLGDQFCSLVYSLSGMYFVGCFYTRFFSKFPLLAVGALTRFESSLYGLWPNNVTTAYQPKLFATGGGATANQSPPSMTHDTRAQEVWSTCGASRNWEWYYLITVLPFVVRLVQSLRRYRDSNLPTHLINAGKYGMGMIHYFFYYYWRHQETPHTGVSYVLWCFTGVVYATYACAWDILMDWSLCKPHARWPLLRPELVYKSQIPFYYFSLASNLCIRFAWLMYVPVDASNMVVRTFIVATLEMLRRVQWNFYRLENEHLGNMDQYRVTREVPLPYHFDTHSNEEEQEQEHEHERGEERGAVGAQSSSWWTRWMGQPRRNGGHG